MIEQTKDGKYLLWINSYLFGEFDSYEEAQNILDSYNEKVNSYKDRTKR
jgi:hypothetical protein